MGIDCRDENNDIGEIDRLLKADEIEKAIELCKQCVSPKKKGECSRYIGWFFYGKDDHNKALKWFDMASALGDVESEYGLACTYFNAQDYVSALEAYKKASEKGYPRANYWIGYMYEHGVGVPKNIDIAKTYYAKGKEFGYLMAERALINVRLKECSYLGRVRVFANYIVLLAKAFFIAKKDISDERLADVPNAFRK